MDPRKQIEKEHYNKAVKRKLGAKERVWQYGSAVSDLIWRSQFYFAEKIIKEIIVEKVKKNKSVRFLDYGCGTGIYSILPAKEGAEVHGIDISEESIKLARELAGYYNVEKKTSFSVMDCEETSFSDNFFDIIFNCGSLSCLDKKKAYSEIRRLLKKDGFFISLDTLGHNPFLNLNRKINFMRGRRTEQTFKNVLKMKDIKMAEDYFNKRDLYFFYFFTPFLISLRKFSGFKYILSVFETIDRVLLKIPFLKKYAFRVMFVFSEPRKFGVE